MFGYIQILVKVLSKSTYALLFATVSWVVFTVSVLFPNRSILFQVVPRDTMSVVEKIQFVSSFYGSIFTNFTWLSAIYTILVSLLFALNLVLFVYYVKKQRALFKGSAPVVGNSAGGLVAGFLGIGCATCGTFVLTTVLSFVGAGAILTYLPLRGQELGILAVLLLMYSIYAILSKIQEPVVCDYK